LHTESLHTESLHTESLHTDLSHTDLSRTDLSRTNLSRTNLSRTNSSRTNSSRTGELSAAMRSRVEEHLASCSSCKIESSLAQRIEAGFGALKLESPPPALLAAILDRIEAADPRFVRPELAARLPDGSPPRHISPVSLSSGPRSFFGLSRLIPASVWALGGVFTLAVGWMAFDSYLADGVLDPGPGRGGDVQIVEVVGSSGDSGKVSTSVAPTGGPASVGTPPAGTGSAPGDFIDTGRDFSVAALEPSTVDETFDTLTGAYSEVTSVYQEQLVQASFRAVNSESTWRHMNWAFQSYLEESGSDSDLGQGH